MVFTSFRKVNTIILPATNAFNVGIAPVRIAPAAKIIAVANRTFFLPRISVIFPLRADPAIAQSNNAVVTHSSFESLIPQPLVSCKKF